MNKVTFCAKHCRLSLQNLYFKPFFNTNFDRKLLLCFHQLKATFMSKGAFFWDYSRMRMHGMRIADYLEYYQAKEWVIRKWFHSWEEWAWELISREPRESNEYRGLMYFAKRTLLWPIPFFRTNRFQNDSVPSFHLRGRNMTRTVFRSFWNWNVTQKNASWFSSVCSHSGEFTLNSFCISPSQHSHSCKAATSGWKTY